jgi:hypothetical protein
MAILSVQTISKTGLNPTFAAAAGGGDSYAADGNEYLEVINGGGSPINVTFVAQVACNFGVANAAHDVVVAVTNGERRKIRTPSPLAAYLDTNGRVQLTYSAVTSVTVGVFKN